MFEINLLPWRRQKQRQEIYVQLLGSLLGFIAGVLCWILLHQIFQLYNHKITTKLQIGEQQFTQVEHQVFQIKQLQRENELWQGRKKFMLNIITKQKRLFDKFSEVLQVTALPIAFSEITLAKNAVRFVGSVSSVDLLALLIRKLNQHGFSQAKIKNVYQISKTGNFHFEVVTQ